MIQTPTSTEFLPLVLNMPSTVRMDADQFYTFCQANPDLWMERTAKGQIVISPSRDGMTSHRNARLVSSLGRWANQDGTGVVFECSGTFALPNQAIRSPDASWVRRSRLAGLTAEQKKKFLPLCPDFVIELRSPSDHLSDLKKKMEAYIANGTELGWLINPKRREVFVYRPNQAALHLKNPDTVSGDPVLPGFILDLRQIWEPGF
jgi:Uma2 family endonuclease